MSLLTNAMDECVLMDKHTASDGSGGYIPTWTDGATFQAAITFDTSMQARAAEKAGVTNLYTVTTPDTLTLEYHDVFRRVEDGKVFRVTSDGDDKVTPKTATFHVRQVTAEEYVLPR